MQERNPMRVWLLAVVALLIAGAPAAAQEDPLLQATPPAAAQVQDGDNDAFGGNNQDKWITAMNFNPMNGDEDWDYNIFFYFSVLAGSQAVIAPLDLEPGARIRGLQCFLNDTSAGDGRVELWRNTYNVTTNARTNVLQGTVSTTGATGFQNPSAVFNIIVRYNEGDERVLYFVIATLPIGDSAVSLRGCRVTWARTMSAAPATATFPNDVPTTHGFFPFVEALAASGVTGGCGAGSFCPDQAVTRGQMAVFLATALGLHFPN